MRALLAGGARVVRPWSKITRARPRWAAFSTLHEATTFRSLGCVSEELVSGLESIQITQPTEVQAKTIPEILKRNDAIVASHTGSGKTLAFLLPIIDMLRADERRAEFPAQSIERRPRCLVILPTRELAYQVFRVAKNLSHHAKFRVACATGGPGSDQLTRKLKAPVDMLIGTPGQFLKLQRTEKMFLSHVEYVVIDEADTMYGSSRKSEDSKLKKQNQKYSASGFSEFEDDLNTLFAPIMNRRELGGQRGCQFTLVSASMPNQIMGRIAAHFPHAQRIGTGSLHKVPPKLQQVFIPVGTQDKMDLLKKVLLKHQLKPGQLFDFDTANSRSTIASAPVSPSALVAAASVVPLSALGRMHTDSASPFLEDGGCDGSIRVAPTIIFVNTVAAARAVAHFLAQEGFSVTCYHAQIPPQKRAENFSLFVRGERALLVCTDVGSRGLDTCLVKHVVCFDFPTNAVDYLHRAGRTARAGAAGKISSFVLARDAGLAMALQRTTTLEELKPLPRDRVARIKDNPFSVKAGIKRVEEQNRQSSSSKPSSGASNQNQGRWDFWAGKGSISTKQAKQALRGGKGRGAMRKTRGVLSKPAKKWFPSKPSRKPAKHTAAGGGI